MAKTLKSGGKPSRIMGAIRTLPLCEDAIKHFAIHRSEYVWRTEPLERIREDFDGLYSAIWLTDKYDHVPVLLVSEVVMKFIMNSENWEK